MSAGVVFVWDVIKRVGLVDFVQRVVEEGLGFERCSGRDVRTAGDIIGGMCAGLTLIMAWE